MAEDVYGMDSSCKYIHRRIITSDKRGDGVGGRLLWNHKKDDDEKKEITIIVTLDPDVRLKGVQNLRAVFLLSLCLSVGQWLADASVPESEENFHAF